MLNGRLFTRDFLIEGICETPSWKSLDDGALRQIRDRLATLFAGFGRIRNPTEPETEKELIWPVLEAIGWADISIQQNLSVKRRDDVPDALLFPDGVAKAKAMPLDPWQRFQHGVCIVEAKRWNRALDSRDPRERAEGVPLTQMLRYLRRVDDVTSAPQSSNGLTPSRREPPRSPAMRARKRRASPSLPPSIRRAGCSI